MRAIKSFFDSIRHKTDSPLKLPPPPKQPPPSSVQTQPVFPDIQSNRFPLPSIEDFKSAVMAFQLQELKTPMIPYISEDSLVGYFRANDFRNRPQMRRALHECTIGRDEQFTSLQSLRRYCFDLVVVGIEGLRDLSNLLAIHQKLLLVVSRNTNLLPLAAEWQIALSRKFGQAKLEESLPRMHWHISYNDELYFILVNDIHRQSSLANNFLQRLSSRLSITTGAFSSQETLEQLLRLLTVKSFGDVMQSSAELATAYLRDLLAPQKETDTQMEAIQKGSRSSSEEQMRYIRYFLRDGLEEKGGSANGSGEDIMWQMLGEEQKSESFNEETLQKQINPVMKLKKRSMSWNDFSSTETPEDDELFLKYID